VRRTAPAPAKKVTGPKRVIVRILLLAEGDAETWDSWSGSARSVVEHLRRAGHQVFVGDVDSYGPQRWVAAALTFSPRRERWSSRFHLAATPFRLRSGNAAQHIAKHRDNIDLIIQIGGTFEPRGRGAIPYAVYCDSNISMAERGAFSGFSDAVSLSPAELAEVREREAGVYRNADVVLAMSEYLRQSFIDDFGVSPERVHTVHAGLNLDLSRVEYPPTRRTDVPPTVVFVGRQFGRKGGDVLLAAFERVRREVPNAQLQIIGPPSLEAMFFGVPCIGTNAWAIPEIVAEGETGYLVPIDDEAALAQRMVELLRDPQLAARMGAAGRRRAERHFTWDAVVRRIEQAAAGVVPAPRRAGTGVPC
jgi:glycosyltransferase involved in cell wall biosynthesis